MADLRAELLAIREEQGRLTPEGVVDAATPDDHPLHDRFEWDDQIAGHQYRVVQAADLIRHVKVAYRPTDEREGFKSVRAFHIVHLPKVGGSSYEPIEEVLQDPLMRILVMRDMERDWRGLRQRYEDFTEFWELVRSEVANTGS